MLCEICRKVIEEKHGVIGEQNHVVLHTHHQTVDSFQKSVSRGCYVCTVQWASFSDAEQRMLLNLEGMEEPLMMCVLFAPKDEESMRYKYSQDTILFSIHLNLQKGLSEINPAAEPRNAVFVLQPTDGMEKCFYEQ